MRVKQLDKRYLSTTEKNRADSRPFSLVLEDDAGLAADYKRVLESLGYQVMMCHRVLDAREAIRDRAPDLILVDIDLPDGNGLDLMDELRNDTRGRFVVISGDSSQRSVIKSIRHRAVEMLLKPVSLKTLRDTLRQGSDKVSTAITGGQAANTRSVAQDNQDNNDCWISHGRCHQLSALRTAISFTAERSRGHALITGESGVDKTGVARYIHQRGRRIGRCVRVDCSVEQGAVGLARLFGQVEPDTGKVIHTGYIDQAVAGTLVLDGVEQMPANMQSRLLSLLDTGYFRRVGAQQGAEATVAVIGIARETGTTDVDESALRSDFLFRLAQTTLVVPNLRQCGEDIQSIARFLLARAAVGRDDNPEFSDSSRRLIQNTPWTRNVRELQCVIERALAQTGSGELVELSGIVDHDAVESDTAPIERWVGTSVWEMEKQLLNATLVHFDGNKQLTAKTLGVSLKTLYNRMNAT